MGIVNGEIASTPAWRRSILSAAILAAALSLLLILQNIFIISRIESTVEERIFVMAARLETGLSDPIPGLLQAMVDPPDTTEVLAGRKVLASYGYGDAGENLHIPVLEESLRPLIPLLPASLVLLILVSITVGSIVIQRHHYTALVGLSDDMEAGRLGKTAENEGVWARLHTRYAQILAAGEGVSRRLKGSLAVQEQTIADISHQLKTPISTLMLNIDLMMDDPNMAKDRRRKILGTSMRQLERMDRLTRHLLMIARLDAGALEFRRDPLDPEEILRESISDVEAIRGERQIRIHVSEGQPPGISGDGAWLIEAFGNILRNAVNHTAEDGTIDVILSWTALFVRWEIRDDGPGFPEGTLPIVFERFRTGHQAPRGDGTGIGLPLARSVVESLGGDISASNGSDGRNGIVIVTMPRPRNLTET